MNGNFCWKLGVQSQLPVHLDEVGQGTADFMFNEWIITYVEKGSCIVSTDTDLILMPQGTAIWVQDAKVTCSQDDKIIYACIGGSAFNILEHKGVLTEDMSMDIFNVLRSLLSSAKLGLLNNEWRNSSAAYDCLINCCELSQKVYAYPPMVSDALNIIKDRYPYLYGVEEIADILAVSKSHFIRVFTLHTGVSPGQYLKEERLKNAVALLQSGNYAVKEIAAMVGYGDENYFCKVFKSRFGTSPGKYRYQRPFAEQSVTPKENIFFL